ncbi:MAG: GNAT family N-acetyltransferase [Rhodospirillales bacterium]|nr:GNAT family N-acetyltransferase [Rhodospirillales bacterium]
MAGIRPACLSDASAIADIQVKTWRDTYAGLIPDRALLGLSRTSHIENWRRILRDARADSITRVAEGPDFCVVGFANAGRARPTNLPYDGEVYTLYVLPDHQGAGHGRRLLVALFSALRAAGCKSALVWVLAGNPARFFYEVMGGTLIATREEPFHGVILSECAYGWPDLRRHIEIRTQASDSSG